MASNISCAAKTPVEMFCKDETGKIVPWGPPGGFKPQSWVFFRYRRKESPLRRLPELFNINHYIVSQARPFIIPLFGENIHRPGNEVQCGRWWIKRKMDNLVNIETRCRLRQFDVFGLLPSLAYRILLEEYYPAAAIALRPDIRIEDMKRCFHEPTPQDVEESILLGERGVWPSLCSLKVRCLLEVELEKAYQDLTKKLDNEIQVNW